MAVSKTLTAALDKEAVILSECSAIVLFVSWLYQECSVLIKLLDYSVHIAVYFDVQKQSCITHAIIKKQCNMRTI